MVGTRDTGSWSSAWMWLLSGIMVLYLNGMVLSSQKFLELAKQVGEFITWKQVECPFEQDANIIHYLHTAPIFTEDGKTVQSLITENTSLHHY